MLAFLRRHRLLSALALSMLLHLLLLWDGELSLPDLFTPTQEDSLLASKKATTVPHVKLDIKAAARPKAQPGATVVSLGFVSAPKAQVLPPKPAPAPTAVKRPRKAAPAPATSTDTANLVAAPPAASNTHSSLEEAPSTTATATATPDTTTTAPTQAASTAATPPPPPPVPDKQAPSFPNDLLALYQGNVMGYNAQLTRTWKLDGNRYRIEDHARKFGQNFRISSEGEVTAEGLRPSTFRVYVNSKNIRFADFDYSNQILHYGRPANPKQLPLTAHTQDVASLGFQLAVDFDGSAQDVQLTLGTGLSDLHLVLSAEETLKLPAGVVRTLHLQGRNKSGTPVEADIWLAPDFLNFPVKIRVLRNNDIIELSLIALVFESKPVLGRVISAEPEDEDLRGLPQNLQDRLDPRGKTNDIKMPGED